MSPLPLFLAVALGFAAPGSPAAAPGGQGREVLTERIDCSASPGQGYALYLPPSYDPARPAPVLFLMDAQGPHREISSGARKFGFVLASSYNSASDEAADPNRQALAAMWIDAAEHLSLDARRVYLGGFSGKRDPAFDTLRGQPQYRKSEEELSRRRSGTAPGESPAVPPGK
jgi:hypothetical protein